METELERFMVKDTKEDLKHWVQKNKIPTKEIESCMKYVLNAEISRWNGENADYWHVW